MSPTHIQLLAFAVHEIRLLLGHHLGSGDAPAPAARAAKTLDRSVFAKTLNAAAASISENRLLSKYRKELEKTQEVLFMERFNPILPDPDPSLASQGRKCIVLSPQIKPACESS